MKTIFVTIAILTLATNLGATPFLVSGCDNPLACSKLGCKRTCEDKWQGDQCLGGYCPKGMVPGLGDASMASTQMETKSKDAYTSNKKPVELRLYNVSPELEMKIRHLIDQEK